MPQSTVLRMLCIVVLPALFVPIVCAQTTVYNNFGPDHGGWDYTYNFGWTVAGENVDPQFGVEQAMSFQSRADGVVTDIWVAFFCVPSSTFPDTVTIKLCENPQGLPPEPGDIMEEWIITEFDDWNQWDPPHHLVGSGTSYLEAGLNYWLWAAGDETTQTGWCMNYQPSLTCPHTLRREGEDWLPVANETASAFRVDVGSTGVEFVSPAEEFGLFEAYPNPFNPTTTISYQMPVAGDITLTVYETTGRQVTELVNGWRDAGVHEFTFDASNLPSGIYLARLITGEFTQTQKLVLVK